ncbi:MAG: phosphotransferase [Rhodanobacteraceae bacterium]
MSAVDTLDTRRVEPYLEAHLDGFKGPMHAEKFEGGQSNPTFLIDAASGRYVLRRQPPGQLLKSAHAVDREFRVMHALAGTGVPVPKMYHLCEDRHVIGSLFYVMEFCDGRILQDAALPEVDNRQRTAMYAETNRVLATLHGVDLEAVGLTDYGKPGNYFERQVSRWSRQYRASELAHLQPMEDLIDWLTRNMPADDGRVALVHGDYRLGNLMWHPSEPTLIAVLDWELSTLGHPLADLAYQCMRMRLPSKSRNPGLSGGLQQIDRAALGIPTEREYVDQYCRRRDLARIDKWEFHLAFSFFRLAAIAQGIAKRAVEGNAASRDAAWAGPAVAQLAAMGLAIAREGA